MAGKKGKSLNEIHVLALFQEACASEGLVGTKIEDAAEAFVSLVLQKGVEIKFPKGAHLVLGVK